MPEEAKVETPVTEQELKAKLDTAYKSGDFKQIASVAGEIAKFMKAKEATELEAKAKELEALTVTIKAAIEKAIKPFYDGGKLDKADGVWYTMDFGDKSTACRLMKSAAKKTSTGGGGGVGKKFDVSTDDLLAKHGAEEYKNGVTFKDAWEGDTDKNKRYAIRNALLKKAGYMK